MQLFLKEKVSAACMVCFCFLIQTSIFHVFSMQQPVPDLILICVCIYGWLRGEHSAMFCGFFGGLLIDIFFMDIIGFYALLYVYLGFLCGQMHRFFDAHEYRIPMATLVTSHLLFLLVRFVLLDVLNGNFHIGYYLLARCLPEMLYTLLCGIALYPVLLFVEQRFVQASPKRKNKAKWKIGDSSAPIDGGGMR
ncbi:MAG: rod shape-determining protein MreD [Lachnospiraceae bacterium]|nr:rod shape-determining protein MreD [Lachnospiraceae bacterium]